MIKERIGSSRSVSADVLAHMRKDRVELYLHSRRHLVIDEAMVRLRQLLIDNPGKLLVVKLTERRHEYFDEFGPHLQLLVEIDVQQVEEPPRYAAPRYRGPPPRPPSAWMLRLRGAGAWIRKHWQDFGHV